MVRPSSSALSFSLVFALLAGCAADAEPPSSEFARFLEARDAMICETFACPMREVDGAIAMAAIGSVERCHTYVAEAFPADDAAIEFGLEGGTIVFDEEAYERCLTRVRATCTMSDEGDCGRLLVGTVPTGASCVHDLECAVGRCDRAAGASCGSCVAPTVALGGDCDAANECATSELGPVTCRYASGKSTCELEELPAIVRSGLGGPCNVQVGDAYAFCDAGAYCDTTKTCRAVLARDAECEPYVDACIVGTACLPTTDDATTRCRTVTTAAEVGAPCGPMATGMGSCDFLANLTCDPTTNLCVRVGDGSAGADCYTTAGCDSGLVCGRTANYERICLPPAATGTACTDNSQCASEYCAIPSGGVNGLCADVVASDSCQAL